ncbi:hypothetical protein C5S53_10950 [Methanophagales archaeon]|nr:hypothetical protein C5S53_10950 [Methanophagales archaeon]
MHKSSRESAKVFHEKDATLIAEKVCALKQLVGSWREEKVDSTPCNGATPSESRIREIRTCGSMRGRRSKDLLLLCEVGADKASESEIYKGAQTF